MHNNPQTIIPALPLAQTSAPTDEEDDRLVRIMLQRWITRVCEDPILLHDEDLRSFIENDFGYQPMPRLKRKTSTGFSLIRRNVPDEDEELQRARFELTKLEGQFFETAKAVDKLSATRKSAFELILLSSIPKILVTQPLLRPILRWATNLSTLRQRKTTLRLRTP